MLVVIAFSLVIYYWAMASHLPSEEMQALVARQSGEHDPNLEMPAA
jgi:hypothetical protein